MMMTMLTPEQLEAIRSRAAAATPGPWTVGDNTEHWSENESIDTPDGTIARTRSVQFGGCNDFDAKFIAHARADIPALLDDIARLRSIATDVASLDPVDSEYDICIFCGKYFAHLSDERFESGNHPEECTWRRALEAVALTSHPDPLPDERP